jgi:hypothetical protein
MLEKESIDFITPPGDEYGMRALVPGARESRWRENSRRNPAAMWAAEACAENTSVEELCRRCAVVPGKEERFIEENRG